jgi:hypothetical protein
VDNVEFEGEKRFAADRLQRALLRITRVCGQETTELTDKVFHRLFIASTRCMTDLSDMLCAELGAHQDVCEGFQIPPEAQNRE